MNEYAIGAGGGVGAVKLCRGAATWGKRTADLLSRGYKISPWRWETHHLLPRELEPRFLAAGLNIDDYTIRLRRWQHILRDYGIHAGPYAESWNGRWASWFYANTKATPDQILDFMKQLKREFRI